MRHIKLNINLSLKKGLHLTTDEDVTIYEILDIEKCIYFTMYGQPQWDMIIFQRLLYDGGCS